MPGRIANTGQVSLGQIQEVIGGTMQTAMSEYYSADEGIPTTSDAHFSGVGEKGTIKLSDFHGAVGYEPSLVLQKLVQTPLTPNAGKYPAEACNQTNGAPWGNPVAHPCDYPIEIIPELTVFTKFGDSNPYVFDSTAIGDYAAPTDTPFVHPKQEFYITMTGVIDDGWNLWMSISDSGGDIMNSNWTRVAYGRETGGGANSRTINARPSLNLNIGMNTKTGHIIRFAHSCGPFWGNSVTNGTIKLEFPNHHPFKFWV